MSDSNSQMSLFDAVLASYPTDGHPLQNAELYERVSARSSLTREKLNERVPIGAAGALHSPVKRKIRYIQQDLRNRGLITHDEAAGRGKWKLTPKGAKHLTPATPGKVLVVFRTNLGLALWGSCDDVFPTLGEQIALGLMSPPYALRQPRAYGNVPEPEYVDWLCRKLEAVVRHLLPGGNIVLNVSNDIFLPDSPARSLYQERLVLALHSRFGLHKMDMIPWVNPCKLPGPKPWASDSRQQLNVTWESLYWFTNDPVNCISDNRRVLEPHTPSHAALLARGGEKRTTNYGDGAYRLREGSFGKPTAGRIPRNLITQGHHCPQTKLLRAAAKRLGLPHHGATMPLAPLRKLIEFMTAPNDLVVDLFAGWFKTAKAAQQAGRRWICTELMGEYALGAAAGFADEEGFEPYGSVT